MFSVTDPSYPNAALGIESDEISAVALNGRRGNYSIKQAGSVQLAPGVLVPSFTDANISDHTAFSNTLTEVVEIAGLLSQKRWSIALPSNTARTAILALESEPASAKELDEVLDWKAEQTFGTPAAELRLATTKISPDKDGRSRFFVTAVTLAVIDEYESHFESRGWKAGLILPRAVGEANWLMGQPNGDSMLISETSDGFTAMLLRGQEPAVVRSVTCRSTEVEDEIFRLVMFYNDRVAGGAGSLDRVLVLGREMVPAKVQTIASEALGRDIRVLTSTDVGLDIPSTSLSFSDIAAPAGLAALGA
ncbi:MAG: hypothetical protein JO314_01165 [Acidobacteria bacterium]|nr:hypothetical protein [Acidobacteriota bacterium]